MNIVYFLTYDYSFKIWDETGNISREIEYFNASVKKNKNYNFIFISYGSNEEEEYEQYFSNSKIIPIYKHIKYDNNKVLRFFRSFKIPFVLNKLLKKEQIDLVKQNQLQGSWVSIIFKLINKKPMILRTGYDVFSFKIKEKKGKHILFFYYALTQISLFFTDLYTVTTKADQNYLNRYFYFPRKKIKIRPNFVNVTNNKPFKERFNNEILLVGRLEDQKNYEFAINEFSNSEFLLCNFGEGSKLKYLIHQASKKNTDIRFNNIIPNNELENIYSEYKFFISCSHYEGNPKSVLEAMGAGCVVFVAKNSNTKEIIKDNENGFLFDLKEGELINLFKSTLLRGDLDLISESASNYVKNQNSLENLVQNEFDDINNLIN